MGKAGSGFADIFVAAALMFGLVHALIDSRLEHSA